MMLKRNLFPNKGSPIATAMSLSIDLHYAQVGIDDRWDWERWCRTCAALSITSSELASLVRLSHKALASAEYNNRFPPVVALLLTIFERDSLGHFTSDVIKAPMPSLKQNGLLQAAPKA